MKGRRAEQELIITGRDSTRRVAFVPVRRSRTKLVAAILGSMLALGPALWATARYVETRDLNHASPVAEAAPSSERFTILAGTAVAERDGEPIPAAVKDGSGAPAVDLGELAGGASTSYEDLIRVRNDGPEPLLVYVDTEKLSETPLHASLSGDEAPGALWLEPGEARPVSLGLAADLVAAPGDVSGALVVRTASGNVERGVPALVTLTAPSQESVRDTLLADAENPKAGMGIIGELAAGLEAPGFEVEGVWDQGAYATDVTITWKPVGPLTEVRATLNGNAIGSPHTVTREGSHVLRLEGRVLGSVPFSKQLSFRIDKTPPDSILVSPPVQVAEAAAFAAKVSDDGPVAWVDLVLLRQPDPEPEPAPSSSPESSSASEAEGPEASPAPSAGSEEAEPIRIRATYDPATGLWVAKAELPAGEYLVHVEAADAVGNVGSTEPQTVRLVTLAPDVRSSLPGA